MSGYHVLPPLLGLAGLAVAFIIYHIMIRHNHGDGVVKKIGDQIHLGAMVFMQREYKMLAIFGLVLLIAIFVSPLGANTAIAFLVGALSSATAGFLGMFAATKANVRTAVAAHNHGQDMALAVSFYGGSIMGLCVASLGLVGLGSLYWYFGGDPHTAHAIHGCRIDQKCWRRAPDGSQLCEWCGRGINAGPRRCRLARSQGGAHRSGGNAA